MDGEVRSAGHRRRACAWPRGRSVQMGASLAPLVGKVFRRGWPDCRVLVAAGPARASGRLSAVFVLEELVQRFEHRIAIAALGASATALAVARGLRGDAPDFHVYALGFADAGTRPLYFVFGTPKMGRSVAINALLFRRYPPIVCCPTVGGASGSRGRN